MAPKCEKFDEYFNYFKETFEQNVGMASAELSALDDLLSLATGYLSEAWDKAVQANNQTYSGTSLEALKVEIDEITKTMVDDI